MQFLRAYIEDKIEIDEKEWAQVASLFSKKHYAQGEEIFSAGEVCEKVYYVADGVCRIYMIDSEGEDITWSLHYHKEDGVLDPFAGDYVSYLTQRESDFFCEAYHDSVIYEADFSALDALYASSLKWMKLGKIISDGQLIMIIERIKMMKRLSTKEKYLLMQKVAPMYESVLTNYQLASVLGVAPQSLSRIKKML